MHRLNTHCVCLGGRSDILVPEQLFLKFVLNFQGIGFVTWLVMHKKTVLGKGYSPGGFCWFGDCLDLWFYQVWPPLCWAAAGFGTAQKRMTFLLRFSKCKQEYCCQHCFSHCSLGGSSAFAALPGVLFLDATVDFNRSHVAKLHICLSKLNFLQKS